jgi:pimeloyl-ACP methyl ester carboxylesterase
VQQNSAATAERIPGARTGVLRGAGHMVNMERPHEFLRAVRALLEEVPDA